MSTLLAFNEALIHFGIGFSLLLAANALINRGRTLSKSFYAGLGMAAALMRVLWQINATGAANVLVHYLPVYFLMFAVGPVIWVLSLELVKAPRTNRAWLFLHLLPALLTGVGTLAVYLSDTISFERLGLLVSSSPSHPVGILYQAAVIHPFLYVTMALVRFVQLWRDITVHYRRYLASLVPLAVVAALAVTFSLRLDSKLLAHLGGFLVVAISVAIFLLLQRHPDFLSELLFETRKRQYATTLLHGVDVEVVKSQLAQLMQRKAYRDPELSLAALAAELLISKHQLSRILNESFQQNFNQYINSFRLADAKDQLLHEPDKSILQIAYEAGFNSKTTFNVQFQKQNKLSPREFRQRQSSIAFSRQKG